MSSDWSLPGDIMIPLKINIITRAEKDEIRRAAWRLRAERSSGMSKYAIENVVRMFEYYDQWGLVGNPNVLRRLLRREPTSLAIVIERIMRERNAVR